MVWGRCHILPRSSPFVIRLTSAGQSEPQRRAGKYTLPYFQVQRAKMILLAAEGWNSCNESSPAQDDFPNLDALAERLLDFQYYWESAPRPFEWKFTRQDLAELLAKLNKKGPA
jgi:hypothetical protein